MEQNEHVPLDDPRGNPKMSIGPKIACRPGRPTSSQIQGKYSCLLAPERPRATEPDYQQQRGRYIMDPPTVPNEEPRGLADDILRGADEIAEFIFGTKDSRRKIYYLAECSRLPVFRLGSVLCARRSVLLTWIAAQESKALPQESSASRDI